MEGSRALGAGRFPFNGEILQKAGPWPPAKCLELRRRRGWSGIRCCCSSSDGRKLCVGSNAAGEMMAEEWRRRPEMKKSPRRVRTRAMPAVPFPSRRYILNLEVCFLFDQVHFFPFSEFSYFELISFEKMTAGSSNAVYFRRKMREKRFGESKHR